MPYCCLNSYRYSRINSLKYGTCSSDISGEKIIAQISCNESKQVKKSLPLSESPSNNGKICSRHLICDAIKEVGMNCCYSDIV